VSNRLCLGMSPMDQEASVLMFVFHQGRQIIFSDSKKQKASTP